MLINFYSRKNWEAFSDFVFKGVLLKKEVVPICILCSKLLDMALVWILTYRALFRNLHQTDRSGAKVVLIPLVIIFSVLSIGGGHFPRITLIVVLFAYCFGDHSTVNGLEYEYSLLVTTSFSGKYMAECEVVDGWLSDSHCFLLELDFSQLDSVMLGDYILERNSAN